MTEFFILLLTALPAWAATQDMPSMPLIQPKKTTVVTTVEEGRALLRDRGFGAKEDEVEMMNLMMVEGSGVEGMDHSSHGNAPTQDPHSGHESGHSHSH